MNLTHKVLKIQDGIQRLSLQKVLAIHLLQMNSSKQSMTNKSRRVYAGRRDDGSLCTVVAMDWLSPPCMMLQKETLVLTLHDPPH